MKNQQLPETILLQSGEPLKISVLHPPLPDEWFHLVWWDVIRDELVSGTVSPWLYTPYFIGSIYGEFAGAMTYYTPADTRDVGVVEFVQTVENHRRKGVASALLQYLIDRFRDDGGMALYLCTANPGAGTLYENYGFRHHVGDGMRYLAPGCDAFDETYFGYNGPGQVRDAHWGDLPRATALYNHHQPRWLVKDYISHCFSDTRYEQHFSKLMKQTEGDAGAFVVLENQGHRVVGAAAATRYNTYYEQHVADLTFRVIPEYLGQAADLIRAIESKATRLHITILQIQISDRDEEQKNLLYDAGFSEAGRLRQQLLLDDGTADLLIYRKHLSHDARHIRGRDDYYGSRFQWQEERVRREKEN